MKVGCAGIKNNFSGRLEALKAWYFSSSSRRQEEEKFLRLNASQNPRWGFCLSRRSFSEGGTFPKKLIFVSCGV
jgi:hypothetical protein